MFRNQVAALVPAVLLLASCGSAGASQTAATSTAATSSSSAAASATAPPAASPSPAASTVTVEEKEFSITAPAAEGEAGPVSFTVANQGTVNHEFDIYQASEPVDALPLDGSGNVDETKVTSIEVSAPIPAGQTATVNATLESGVYYFVCNQPGHYKLGMRFTYTVH